MTTGFFTPEELAPTTPLCQSCKLYRKCTSPKMPVMGGGRHGILIVGEYPTAGDDAQGGYFIGESGDILRRALLAHDIDLDQDCWTINAVSCRPSGQREPTNNEIGYCTPVVEQAIKNHKPTLVLLMGSVALKSFMYNRWRKKLGEHARWVGHVIPDRTAGTWVSPMYAPTYLLKNRSKKALNTVFDNMLTHALSYLKKDFPISGDERKHVKLLNDDQAVRYLTKLNAKADDKKIKIAIDYETTGLKPYRRGHRIVCCSIATSATKCVVFKVNEDTSTSLKQILKNPRVLMIAHNMGFESRWSRTILKTKCRGWFWDSMLCAHILDARGAVANLKFQTCINFGVADYDSSIEHLLKGRDENDANSFNALYDTITPEQLNELQLYCGLDSIYTFKLHTAQRARIKKHKGMRQAYRLFHEGVLAFNDLEKAGICVDDDYCTKNIKLLRKKVKTLRNEIENLPHVKNWRKKYGQKFKLDSNKQLAEVLYDDLRLTPLKSTAGGNHSVDDEALRRLKQPWIDDLLTLRKLNKIISTYFGGLIRETIDGKLRPFFHLTTARSFRSSSSNPNFHNFPKRDKEIHVLVRSAVIPSPGNKLKDWDYASVEVCMSACAHKDPAMIAYITDKTTDMHRDLGQELFFIPESKDLEKDARFITKNSFTFAQFYGNWFDPCATDLWNSMKEMNVRYRGISLRKHLKNEGYGTLEKYKRHVEAVEHDFWNVRFKEYNKWRKWHLKEYERKGWFDLLTGFRCSGYMTKNQIYNRPIQGPAFHLLLWSLNRLNEIRKKEKWRSKFIGQIHDSIMGDIVPEEEEEISTTVERVMTVDIREHWPWIIVPLSVDSESTGINEPWSKMK